MKTFRIRPDINGTIAVWTLDEKNGLSWKKVFRDPDITVVRVMKDHLLKPPTIYTSKNNVPEKPVRVRGWQPKTKTERIKIKKTDLPESLKY